MDDIHPYIDLHTCKMEHDDDSESKIVELVKCFNKKLTS